MRNIKRTYPVVQFEDWVSEGYSIGKAWVQFPPWSHISLFSYNDSRNNGYEWRTTDGGKNLYNYEKMM